MLLKSMLRLHNGSSSYSGRYNKSSRANLESVGPCVFLGAKLVASQDYNTPLIFVV